MKQKLDAKAFIVSFSSIAVIRMLILLVSAKFGIYKEAFAFIKSHSMFLKDSFVGIVSGSLEIVFISLIFGIIFVKIYNKIVD